MLLRAVSAVLLLLKCLVSLFWQWPQRGQSPSVRSFVRSSICSFIRPPQALSGLKSVLSGLKSALSGLESERADFRTERAELRPEGPGFRSERANFRPEGERTKEQMDKQTSEQKSRVLQDFVLFRAAVQKKNELKLRADSAH